MPAVIYEPPPLDRLDFTFRPYEPPALDRLDFLFGSAELPRVPLTARITVQPAFVVATQTKPSLTATVTT